MTKPSLFLLASAAFSLLLASCATNTPAKRIARNPEMFENLPRKQKTLVEQGKIDRGMSPEAVFLAWGNPDRRIEGEKAGVPTMRWDYYGLYPVHTTGFFGGFGWGSGCFYGGPYYSVAPQITYLPERRATVVFRNRRVDSWERATR